VNRILRFISFQNLVKTRIHRGLVSVRISRQIRVRQQREQASSALLRQRELDSECLGQTALLGLDKRSRVVRHERPEGLLPDDLIAKVAGAVKGMKIGGLDAGGVSDVVQPRSRLE